MANQPLNLTSPEAMLSMAMLEKPVTRIRQTWLG